MSASDSRVPLASNLVVISGRHSALTLWQADNMEEDEVYLERADEFEAAYNHRFQASPCMAGTLLWWVILYQVDISSAKNCFLQML